MADQEAAKICFVIAPIGEEGGEIRERSDKVLRHIIRPAAEACGYDAVRADEIAKSGDIPIEVIEHLLNDPLVVADLTDHNANVFYELAVRHMVQKPAIPIIRHNQGPPFDISHERMIFFDLTNPDSVEASRKQLITHMEAAQRDPDSIRNPISTAQAVMSFRQTEDPWAPISEEIISRLQHIQSVLDRPPPGGLTSDIVGVATDGLTGIRSALSELTGELLPATGSRLTEHQLKALSEAMATVDRCVNVIDRALRLAGVPPKAPSLGDMLAGLTVPVALPTPPAPSAPSPSSSSASASSEADHPP